MRCSPPSFAPRGGQEVAHHFVADVAAEERADEAVAQLEVLGQPADLLLLAPQDELGLDPREHHREVERLRHVVVRPQAQRLHHVLGRVPGGGHDDREVGLRDLPPHALQHVDAREAGHHDVEQHEVERLPGEAGEGPLPALRHLDREAPAPQPAREHVAVELVVVHDEEPDARGVERRSRHPRRGERDRRLVARGRGGSSTRAGGDSRSRKTTGSAAVAVGGTASSTTSRALRAASRIFVRSAT